MIPKTFPDMTAPKSNMSGLFYHAGTLLSMTILRLKNAEKGLTISPLALRIVLNTFHCHHKESW